jgi:hypothetical protein
MSRLEREEEREFCRWCSRNKIITIKFTPSGDRGWPDRICIAPSGVHVWIEFKRRGKTPTKLQYYKMEVLKEQHANVHWVDSAEDGMKVMEGYL